MTIPTPFEYINSICTEKIDLIDAYPDEPIEQKYPAFFVNKALSQYPDTIMYANEMNIHHAIPSRMQYRYLLNTIRQKRRPNAKWPKKSDDEDLDAVKRYYGYNTQNARSALKILTPDQINTIKQHLDLGG